MEREKLLELAKALDGDLPSDFKWDFVAGYEKPDGNVCGCAVGLAVHLGIIDGNENASVHDMAGKGFDLSRDQANDLFFTGRYYRSEEQHTPQNIAKGIRKFLRAGQ